MDGPITVGAAGLIGRDAWVLETITETDGRVVSRRSGRPAPQSRVLQPGTSPGRQIRGATSTSTGQ